MRADACNGKTGKKWLLLNSDVVALGCFGDNQVV